MSTQHTPGPWFLPRENAGSAATQVWARGGDVRVANCDSGAISLPGRQADARLISAAPDLLQALQWLYAIVLRDELMPRTVGYMQSAEAAIAKATGGEL